MTNPHNKPIDTLRDGSLKATIWPNQTDDGGVPLLDHLSPQLQGQERSVAGHRAVLVGRIAPGRPPRR